MYEDNPVVASANRNMLSRAGVLTISIIGEPGCGKTSIIATTLRQRSLRVGAIIADPIAHRQEASLVAMRDRVVLVDVHRRGHRLLHADDVQHALRRLDLCRLDVLLIETTGAIDEAMSEDLGEHKQVLVLSAAAGDDKPARIAATVSRADAVVLSKADLLPLIPFNRDQFVSGVRASGCQGCVISFTARATEEMTKWIKQLADWRKELG